MREFKRSEVNPVIEEIVECFSKKSTRFMPANEIGKALREHPSMVPIFGRLQGTPNLIWWAGAMVAAFGQDFSSNRLENGDRFERTERRPYGYRLIKKAGEPIE
jgi:hypothetical protein